MYLVLYKVLSTIIYNIYLSSINVIYTKIRTNSRVKTEELQTTKKKKRRKKYLFINENFVIILIPVVINLLSVLIKRKTDFHLFMFI